MTDSEKKWWDGDKKLRTTGELVSGGGLSGGVMSVLYLIIGMAFWGLVGFGADWLLNVFLLGFGSNRTFFDLLLSFCEA